MSKFMKVIGLMSGTSMDGVDVSVIETNGEEIKSFGASNTYPYPDELRDNLSKVVLSKTIDKNVEREFTEFHAHVVGNFVAEYGLKKNEIDLVGFHGHTVFHDPDNDTTVQMGDGKLLSNLLDINVVNDFRTKDVLNGGQGAPLAPVFHKAILEGETKPIVVVNIGGVSNVTYIGSLGNSKRQELVAFDTGPGNALIDDYVSSKFATKCDYGGGIAARGKIIDKVLDRLLESNFFVKNPPKSLDRNEFNENLGLLEGVSDEDAVATLTEFTAKSIALSLKFMPEKPLKWVVCGGGRHNKTLMTRLGVNVGAQVVNIDDLGFNGDAIEAQAFAYIAVRSIYKMAYTFPSTTGVAQPVSGGAFYQV